MGKLNYRIPNTNDFREIYVKVTDTLPIGAVCQYGGSTAPSGYLMCNGQAVSRTTYADLFKAIGTSFGSGDGVTTFNVPNFNGRVPVGLDGTDTDFDTIGETGGSKYLQEHSHNVAVAWGEQGADFPNTYYPISQTGPTYAKYVKSGGSGGDFLKNAGTGDSGNLQPYTVTNFIIKASKKVALDKGNVVDSLDGSDTDSAPSIRAVNEALVEEYSTDEVKTNKVWIDGKPIYRKCFEILKSQTSSTSINIDITGLNCELFTDLKGTLVDSNGSLWTIPTGIVPNPTLTAWFSDNTLTTIKLRMGNDLYAILSKAYVIIEYTKTTD